METIHFVIVGHVDHGKSTLIGRLLHDTGSLPPDRLEEVRKTSEEMGRETDLAYLLDHLEEERQQGVTIDTTQVFFKTPKRHYVIIDAPGHVEFVKNMITGAAQAEAAVLIVDAAEGVQEQTKRHAYFLSLLGLRQTIVAVNKMDLVGFSRDRFDEVVADVRGFLGPIGIEPRACIPLCATAGDNVAEPSARLPWYQGLTFLQTLDTLERATPSEKQHLALPVQDVYKVDGKRIIVGRVEAGVLEAGAGVTILPGGQASTVASVERFGETRDWAAAGECIGLTLGDASFADRGSVICERGKEQALTGELRADIFWMARTPYAKGERVAIRCATQETTCRVTEIAHRLDSSTLETLETGAGELRNLEVADVVLTTKKPLAAELFSEVRELGRFVLVRDDDICAGGIITGLGAPAGA